MMEDGPLGLGLIDFFLVLTRYIVDDNRYRTDAAAAARDKEFGTGGCCAHTACHRIRVKSTCFRWIRAKVFQP